ncbi:MAG: stage II sporulation protein E [Bacillota bacterium]|nr:stage II sporulation protein E [Bacillota bacterium]
MQYGGELIPYKRIRKSHVKVEGKTLDYKLFVIFLSGILISRVTINSQLAPFGIALCLYFLINKDFRDSIPAGLGCFIGYATLYSRVNGYYSYIFVVGSMYGLDYVIRHFSKNGKLIMLSALSFTEFLLLEYLFMGSILKASFLNSSLKIAAVIPIYYIIRFSIYSIDQINTKHIFKNDELLGIAFIAALFISGTYGLNIFSISAANIASLFLVIIISYVKGPALGSASGAAIGILIGMTSGYLMEYVTILTLCALSAGIFREGGKLLSLISFILTFSLIKIYSGYSITYKLLEALIAAAVFFVIRESFYKSLGVEFDYNQKIDFLNGIYIEKIKKIFYRRLDNYSDVLYKMSNTLDELVGNENLTIKNKSSELIQNLADTVCSGCSMRNLCWKRESYKTYQGFSELIENYQSGSKSIPKSLDDKCLKRTELIRRAEDIVNKFIISQMWESRLNEGREIIASQINNIALSVEEVASEIDSYIKFDPVSEEKIKRALRKKGISFNQVFCFIEKNGRTIVNIDRTACNGSQFCKKNILPEINRALDKTMCISKDGCSIDSSNNCSINFVETPEYHIASFVQSISKDGEVCCGDSYYFGDIDDGNYISIISDGMGTGPQAGQESRASVELIEKLTRYGFSKTTAINTVNSIMTLKFTQDEKFSTVDMMSVDLYSGEADFIKVGAVPSFIKNGEKIEAVESRTLPIGVLDKADIDTKNKKLKQGDMIIMMSDGILDYNNQNAGDSEWLKDFLISKKTIDPEKLCYEIMEKSKELRKNKINDDMTVVVSKVYQIY